MKCFWNYKSGKNEDGRFGWGFAFLFGGRLLENGSVLDYISCAFLFQAAAPKSLCARIQVLPSLFPCNSCLYTTCLHYHWCKQAWLLMSVIFHRCFVNYPVAFGMVQATSGLGAAAAYALSKEGFYVILGIWPFCAFLLLK